MIAFSVVCPSEKWSLPLHNHWASFFPPADFALDPVTQFSATTLTLESAGGHGGQYRISPSVRRHAVHTDPCMLHTYTMSNRGQWPRVF